jgi:hypothetical protein
MVRGRQRSFLRQISVSAQLFAPDPFPQHTLYLPMSDTGETMNSLYVAAAAAAAGVLDTSLTWVAGGITGSQDFAAAAAAIDSLPLLLLLLLLQVCWTPA